MYVACSTLSFSKLSLEDALRTVREMRFTKADLAIHDDGPHLTPAEVAADVEPRGPAAEGREPAASPRST